MLLFNFYLDSKYVTALILINLPSGLVCIQIFFLYCKTEGKYLKTKYRPEGILININAMIYFEFN